MTIAQTSYGNMQKGFPGLRDGIGHQSRTFVNDLGATRKVVDVVLGAANAFAYGFQVEGIPIEFTSDGSGTIAEARDGLYLAARSNPALERWASFVLAGDDLRVIAKDPGYDLSVTESPAISNLSLSVEVAHAAAESVPFGRALVKRTGTGTTDQSCRLPHAPTAQVATLTVSGATNAKVYSFIIRMLRTGATYLVEYTADGSATVTEVVAGLVAKVNALGIPVTAVDADPAFTLTSDTAGDAFAIDEVDAQIAVEDTTPSVDPVFIGLAEFTPGNVDPLNADPNNQGLIAPYSDISVGMRGRWWVEVEEAVTAFSDPVYYRFATSGANTGKGMWRKSADSGTARLVDPRVAQWVSSTTGRGLARLELNLP